MLEVKPRAVAAAPQHCPRISGFLSALAAGISLTTANAGPPELKFLYPAAAQRGTNTTVNTGQADTWPRMWADVPGIKFAPTPLFGTYNVEVSADCPVGPHLVRAWNAEGASAPRAFIVSSAPEFRSVEPNDAPASAQAINELPAIISGQLDKNGDVDCYSVSLKRGQTLVAWVEGYVLASPFDGLLRITDRTGRVLAFNHDYQTLDPLLAWHAPEDGDYFVQIMGFAHPASSSIQFTGSENCVYRLHLTVGPLVRFTIPAKIQAGTKAPVRLIGWNLSVPACEIDSAQLAGDASVPPSALPGVELLQPIGISGIPELVEPEPTAADAPTSLTLPSGITGRITVSGEEDRFSFTAVKGKPYDIKVTAAAFGSPLDAWLRIENSERKEIAKNDDAKGRDPQIIWTAPADGMFTVAVGSVTHCGGEDYAYRLAISESAPEISATIAAHSALITAGKTADLKVTIKRINGFKSKVQLAARNLPAGISAAPVDVPEKDGEATLQLTATSEVSATSQAFTLVITEPEGAKKYPVHYWMAATSEDNGVPQGFADLVINSTDQLWLTVAPAPAQ